MATIRVNIKIRKYLWKEIVHDVAYFLYATFMISDALSKRFLKRPIGQTLSIAFFPIIWLYNSAERILKKILITAIILIFTFIWLLVTFSAPVVLILVAMGKIQ